MFIIYFKLHVLQIVACLGNLAMRTVSALTDSITINKPYRHNTHPIYKYLISHDTAPLPNAKYQPASYPFKSYIASFYKMN